MSDLTSNIVAALAVSPDLADWCDSKYGQEQTILLGVDYDNLPGEEQYPLVMVLPVSAKTGPSLPNEEAVYLLTCAIIDPAELVRSGNQLVMHQLLDLENFRRLVLAAVEAADLCGGNVEAVDIDHDPLEMLPIFSTNMIITIGYPAAMRSRWAR